ncbi:unnamed protein product [Prunus armeniaca]|uniref:Uncharacterized protein n=1 Tax=Prunus armeniaca TaxID=36596 RepID=A0A6J5VBQ9_PRUAR|nr:hypothetical protein GBA52_018514 [Prunus armeniaca]CAB4285641.1 unnamed protein product [Prunus armeniaca]CAB4315900.1 unnamed protein product [Prunus armeniaca]
MFTALLILAVTYCGHNVYRVNAATSRLIPSSIPKSPQRLPCAVQECQCIPTSCSPRNLCSYDYEYEDDSVTEGVLAKETNLEIHLRGGYFIEKRCVWLWT